MHSGILLPSLWEPYFPSPFFHSWPQIFCLLFNELHLKVHSLALQRWREFWDFDAPVKEIFLELSSTQFSRVSLLSRFFLLCIWLQWAASERCGANCNVQSAKCKQQSAKCNVIVQLVRLCLPDSFFHFGFRFGVSQKLNYNNLPLMALCALSLSSLFAWWRSCYFQIENPKIESFLFSITHKNRRLIMALC